MDTVATWTRNVWNEAISSTSRLMDEIMSLSNLMELLQPYASPAAANSANVQQDFEQVAQSASPLMMSQMSRNS
jgi:hypothetical protein